MQKNILTVFVALVLTACGIPQFNSTEFESLQQAFRNPPQSAKPMVWWHWMNGNITPEGLRSDILWMHRAGIGGFHVFDAGLDTPQMVEHRLEYMTPEWKDAFAGAIALADSLGMEVAIASSPGWSSTGGPWVEPVDAMKKLTWNTMLVEGGASLECTVPEPFTVSSRFQNVPLPYEYNHHQDGPIPEWYYKDIAAFAVRLPDTFRTLEELGAKVSSSGGSFDVATLTDGNLDNAGLLPPGPDGFGWIQYEFPEPQSFKAVTIINQTARSGGHGVPASCQDSLQISDDGRNWKTLCGITQGAAQEQTEYIPEASARFWRLKLPNPKASYHYGILRLPAAKATEVGEFNLLSHLPVNHFEEKAGFAAVCDLALYPSAPDAQPSEVIDITDKVQDGILRWTAPEGRWMIYRFGTSLTGKKNHPASMEATGLEVDKLDKDAFSRYLHTYLDMYKDAAGGLLGKHGIQYLLIDSYESGAQTWTDNLPAEFKARRGYDLMPWLPATAGVVIESTEATEKFLWDFRRTLGELFAENYDNATAVCREYSMDGVFIESHEHGRNCLADGISIKKSASYPMSAMWIQSTFGGSTTRRTEGLADIRESAATAHIYGQNLVAAESLTASGVNRQAYTYCPENLKATADLELYAGVNRFVIHESSHQPLDDVVPGMGMYIYGQWFHRHETWAEQASAWTSYISRSCAMMQQGRYVADFLYYYGEDTNVTAQFSRSEPDVPFGYNYDFIGPEALLKEVRVKNGRLVTRSGMEYSALCVGGQGLRMSDEIRKRIEKFKASGVMVIENGDCHAAVAGLAPDVQMSVEPAPLMFAHRTLPSAEIYWLCNVSGRSLSQDVSFRCNGRRPMLWHPEDASIRELSWSFEDGRTVIPLEFTAGEAYFVVFGEPTRNASFCVAGERMTDVQTIDGPWEISFQAGRGAPASAVFDNLSSWTESPVPGIRYFSGTAVYRKSFIFEPREGRFELDLGKVCNIAEVKLNGVHLRTLWRTPFKVDITDALKAGENLLEISVTNLWPNRLIGDEQPGVKQRITYTTWPFYKAGDPLLPSGLLGPVRILSFSQTI
ncbi:MAG: hypothetical protein IKZ60_07705 [Bacteroidales bacterium]|nr:hypothetical protein [Bacteroidales bacterium]